MGQITLELDAETERQMKAAADSAGVSQSRWLADFIRQRLANQWPQAVADLAGSWPDMPSLEEIRDEDAEDVLRERL